MTPLLAQGGRPFPDWQFLQNYRSDILERLVEHLLLTFLAVAIGMAIAFPLAILAVRFRPLYSPLLQVTGVLYTVPSLALFVLLVALGTGLTLTTALIGLTIYTLLILIRNIVTGLTGVPDHVVEAAEAMGYGGSRLLWRVRLPLAVPVIFAGIRIATVTTIGLVTITTTIGQGGLGQIFSLGFRRDNFTAYAIALLLTVLLAVFADLLLAGTQRLLTPWTRRAA